MRIPRTVRAEYNRLKAAHARTQEAGSPIYGMTDREISAEQDAFDTLIDYVDAHDLTWTELDPRGTYAEFLAANPLNG